MTAKPVLLHFKFDNFTSLSTEVDSNVCTEVQTDCNGNKWRLKLYPGGERRNTKEGHVGLYLRSCNDDSIDLKYNISIINYEGISNNLLKDGALRINVTIQVKQKKQDMHQPLSPLSSKMLNVLKSSSFPSEEAAIKCGKELINSANKYDLVELKIADSKCSPLLKVYALSSGDGEDESMGVAELRKELASVSWMWMGRKNLWCQDWTRPGGEKQINVSSQSAS
ncbi:hypothetical protein ACHAWO_003312 [Cyclotella atomus]|uniref:MATH domain-containing protein n=1 Tax=Cyclotella atomus TaxID=382360 RepID=A0ABD3N4T1_9STRA